MKHDIVLVNINQLSDLFSRNKSTISRHIKNIYESGELDKKGMVAKIATIQKEGDSKDIWGILTESVQKKKDFGYSVESLFLFY